MRLALLLLLAATLTAHAQEPHWYRGNTHTHTFASDGDTPAADVAQWYKDQGYDFLVITDHDMLTCVDDAPLLMIPGEEVTDRLPKKPLHLNALGIGAPIQPQHGATVVEVLQNDVNAIRKAGGIVAINHPNFGWAFGTKELMQVEGFTLLEIASGHPYVNMQGPPTVESMWDDLLTAGRRIWGIAVDDSHHFTRVWGTDIAPPGKAWIVVRSIRLDRESILDAIRRGEFYASTGPELADYQVDAKSITITIRPKNLAHYVTQFIGPGGKLLLETAANPATFVRPADAAYVRAKVIDSNGRAAWTQPAFR
jgi:hypothetical protein